MPTSIRLAPDIEERIDRLAASTGRTKAFYLREIIQRGLDDIEDIYRADTVMERIRKGEEDVIPLDALERNLGLAD